MRGYVACTSIHIGGLYTPNRPVDSIPHSGDVTAAHGGCGNGDLAALPVPDGHADTVILHQVLHFIPDPEGAIGELARILSPKGRLLIVDFAPHDREELRDRDAHARLGFSDEQIAGWFATAGLECDLIENLKGGTLTVKLWRARKRQESRLKVIAA